MKINTMLHRSQQHKLSFESDHFKRSQWHIANEQGEIIAVADIPVKLFKRTSIEICDGASNSLLCTITDPKDSPFSIKDRFNIEYKDGSIGKVIFVSKIGYESYSSNAGVELRVAGNRKTFYRAGKVIAKCKDNPLKKTTTIVYWDMQYAAQIISLFFAHVLKDFKDYHNE